MRKSKLEIYENILKVLADRHMTIDTIAYACSMDCFTLSQRLDFLLKHGLVEERRYNKKKRYALTRRGLAIFKTLALTKRLEKLQINIKRIGKTSQAIPAFSDYNTKKAKRQK